MTAVQLVRVLLAVAIANVLLARLRSKGEAGAPEPGSRQEGQDGASEEGTGYGKN